MKLAALFETGPNLGSRDFKDVDIWDSENWGPANVRVTYEHEPSSYTDHPYGNGTAREYHGCNVQITSAVLLSEMEQFNDEGELTGEVIRVGVDLTQHKMWKEEYAKYFEDKIADDMEDCDDDYDDPRDWDRA